MARIIPQITAAVILVFSLLAVTGVIGEINETGSNILTLMIGSAITFLFLAQTKKNGTVVTRDNG